MQVVSSSIRVLRSSPRAHHPSFFDFAKIRTALPALYRTMFAAVEEYFAPRLHKSPHAIAAVCADSGRAFFLRTTDEINVISKPIGNGSMNVISTLYSGFAYITFIC